MLMPCQLCIEKTKIKKEEAGNGPFKKNNKIMYSDWLKIVVLLRNIQSGALFHRSIITSGHFLLQTDVAKMQQI